MHLPSERLRIQTPTAEDLALAAAMAAEGADFLAVSFVRDADDLDKVRDAVAPLTDPVGRQDRDACRRSSTSTRSSPRPTR